MESYGAFKLPPELTPGNACLRAYLRSCLSTGVPRQSLFLPALQPYYDRKPCHPRNIYTKTMGTPPAQNLEVQARDVLALVKVHASPLLEGKLHSLEFERRLSPSLRTEHYNNLDDHVNKDT